MTQKNPQQQRKRAAFHPLPVTGIRPLTDNAVEITFSVPKQLQDDYNYIPGQYIALRATIDGEEVRRSYSLCREPSPGTLAVAVKKTPGGRFSTWVNEQLALGDTVEVMNPQGAFTSGVHVTGMNNPQALADSAGDGANLVAFAAGSGITPIMAIIKAVLKHDTDSCIELIYANKTATDVMFSEELSDLKDRYPARLSVHHILSRESRINPLHSGRIDQEKLAFLLDNVIAGGNLECVDEWFLCGPMDLVQMWRDELSHRGIPRQAIKYELFATTAAAPAPRRDIQISADEPTIQVNFQLDGLSSSVETPKSGTESVLNAALRVRSDVPFACAGGVCGTCRAKLIEGEVEMAENYALEPDEIAQGYVLTCQSTPTTDSITVDFDS